MTRDQAEDLLDRVQDRYLETAEIADYSREDRQLFYTATSAINEAITEAIRAAEMEDAGCY